MLLKWFVFSTSLVLSPVYGLPDNSPRIKRQDDVIPCDKGWYYFRDKCYKSGATKVSDRINWENALERCKEVGGNLVTIQSQEEQNFIISFILLKIKHPAWIGLHDRVNESEYTWNDGSAVNYTNWDENEPSGPQKEEEDCTEMVFEANLNRVGLWNDISCTHALAYVCQAMPTKKKKSPNPLFCSSAEGGGWKFENSCYHVVTELKSWEEAEKHCQDNFNGHLITILDKSVDIFLDYILSNMHKEFWIGIKIQEQLQQNWTSGWHVSYNGMKKDHGEFIEGTCVVRKARAEWTMVSCAKKYSFICEVTKVSPPVLTSSSKNSHCPEEPHDWRDLGGDFCYYIETEKSVTWLEANFDCMRRGGELLSLHSDEESAILHPFVKYTQERIFIGLFRTLADEEVFAWSDGSEFDYKNWNPNEPNRDDEKCSELHTSNMKWNDMRCDEKKGYICSVKKITPNTTTPITTTVESTSLDGYVSVKALIGVSTCILLLVILLGVVVYYFRSGDRRKNSIANPAPPPCPSTDRPRYRSAMEITLKDDDDYYEKMQ